MGSHGQNLHKHGYIFHGTPCSKRIKDRPSEEAETPSTNNSARLVTEETKTRTGQRAHAPILVVHTSTLESLH